MPRTIDDDELLAALRSERPAVRAVEPDMAVLRSIVRPRRRRALVATAAAVAAGAVVVGQLDLGGRSGIRVTGPPPAAADIARIASTSKAALASSGRALLDFHVGRGSMGEQRVSGTVSFAGDDVEMVLAFAPDGRGPGFEARNRTVDGQFYLYDAGRWARDTNAAGTRGGDMFNADPRTLVEALHPAAGFEVVAVEGDVRHLRATRLQDLPALNLSLGPLDPSQVESLELWVGPDDVVQRLDVATLELSTRFPNPPLTERRSSDGKTKVKATQPPDPSTGVTVEIRSRYSLRFVDIGTPIVITAPAGAVDVAGQG